MRWCEVRWKRKESLISQLLGIGSLSKEYLQYIETDPSLLMPLDMTKTWLFSRPASRSLAGLQLSC